ncbi:DUF5324 family protein [Streptomyces abyssalis]|uniref:Transcriptional regulator n=2 Tax=Streptomyces abyssalis TaxID=933944 RepID=A0A1E7JPT0_9ACTN|nr:DUF5324 family protein [Streptomyces abyssalis]OEU90244.1 transcriptional regulator [Streptomyces abyssalis]
MTRMDTVRAATGNTKESVRHAAEVMAPYAGTARDTAVQYAHEAGARLGPKVSHAARQARTSARDGYDHVVVPRIAKARKNLPPELDRAAAKAAKRTRRAARKATDYAAPRIEHAVADARSASGPVREEAASRSAAAFAALRGQVSAKEIEKLVHKRDKRARRGRLARRLGLLGLLAGGAYAAWRWWDKQANPDWLVEPPEATEVGDRASLTSVGGAAAERRAGDGQLDPEVEAKAKEAKEAETKAKRRGQ